MLLSDDDDEQEKAGRLAALHGAALIGLGSSISLDDRAIGFSLGLTHLPLVPVITGIAAQALLAAQLVGEARAAPSPHEIRPNMSGCAVPETEARH